MGFSDYVKLLRIHQWVKNLLIFAPFFFSFNYKTDILLNLIIVFFIFSITASAIYVINDIIDLEYDKNHPDKKNRPLPSNKITINNAVILIFVLLSLSLSISFLINKSLFYLVLIYIILNLIYSLFIKKIIIWDVTFLASNYIIRLLVLYHLTQSYLTGTTINIFY